MTKKLSHYFRESGFPGGKPLKSQENICKTAGERMKDDKISYKDAMSSVSIIYSLGWLDERKNKRSNQVIACKNGINRAYGKKKLIYKKDERGKIV